MKTNFSPASLIIDKESSCSAMWRCSCADNIFCSLWFKWIFSLYNESDQTSTLAFELCQQCSICYENFLRPRRNASLVIFTFSFNSCYHSGTIISMWCKGAVVFFLFLFNLFFTAGLTSITYQIKACALFIFLESCIIVIAVQTWAMTYDQINAMALINAPTQIYLAWMKHLPL